MSDYISRQAAIEAVEKCQQYKVSKEDYAVDFAEVKTELMMLPTADVRENVNGKWKIEYTGDGWNHYIDVTCTNCGKTIKHGKPFNFCPNCGADMRHIVEHDRRK